MVDLLHVLVMLPLYGFREFLFPHSSTIEVHFEVGRLCYDKLLDVETTYQDSYSSLHTEISQQNILSDMYSLNYITTSCHTASNHQKGAILRSYDKGVESAIRAQKNVVRWSKKASLIFQRVNMLSPMTYNGKSGNVTQKQPTIPGLIPAHTLTNLCHCG